MVFQCVFTSFKDHYVNTNYNFDLFGYKIVFLQVYKNKKTQTILVLALSKDPEFPKKSVWVFLGFFQK